jgi:Lon protease-like protein
VLDRFDDGRLNIVVEGRDRFRLLDVAEGDSFSVGSVEPVGDVPDAAGEQLRARALELFRQLVELTGSDVEEPDPGAEQLSFELAARFEFAPPVKQELLQSTSERLRLDRLCELLEGAVELVARQEEIGARARTNGKVDPQEP